MSKASSKVSQRVSVMSFIVFACRWKEVCIRGVVVNFDLAERFPRPRSQQRGSLRPRARHGVSPLEIFLRFLMPNPAFGGNLGQKINWSRVNRTSTTWFACDQRYLPERRSSSKIFAGTAFYRIPAPLHTWLTWNSGVMLPVCVLCCSWKSTNWQYTQRDRDRVHLAVVSRWVLLTLQLLFSLSPSLMWLLCNVFQLLYVDVDRDRARAICRIAVIRHYCCRC